MAVSIRTANGDNVISAAGDGVADDTVALQAAIASVAGSRLQATASGEVFIPQGTYVISSPLYYIGGAGVGIKIRGAKGRTRGPSGTIIRWSPTAPANLPMFVLMGANATEIEDLDFDANNRARVGIAVASCTHLATTTLGTPVSPGSATVTPGSMSNITVGTLLPIDYGPNIEFVYVTATTATTFTATFTRPHQANASVGLYIGSSGVKLSNVGVSNVPNGIGSWGGNPGTASGGMVFGNATSGATPQVDSIAVYEPYVAGFSATPMGSTGIAFVGGGNVKNGWIKNLILTNLAIGIEGLASGVYDIHGGDFANIQSYSVIAGTGQVKLTSLEDESGLATGHRFVLGNMGTNPGTLIVENCSFQAAAPADDYVISYSGSMTLIGNFFGNERTSTSVAKVQNSLPANGPQFVTSIGNYYQNAPAGYAPLYGPGNTPILPNPALAVSFGDTGGAGGAIVNLTKAN